MASEMVNLIARAIEGSEEYDSEVRAVCVLEHLLIPTETMMAAGRADASQSNRYELTSSWLANCWRAMIQSELEAYHAE